MPYTREVCVEGGGGGGNEAIAYEMCDKEQVGNIPSEIIVRDEGGGVAGDKKLFW